MAVVSIHHAPERPRERLWRTGPITLGDNELLAIVLGTGVRDHPALEVASELIRNSGGIVSLSRASPRELAQVNGVGSERAARISATFELGRRAVELVQHRDVVTSPEHVFRTLAPRFAGVTQEIFLVIGVDSRNGLLDIVEVARGTVAGVEVHPREVFRPLVRMAAFGGVLVHNHPTGDPRPSHEDIELTRRLRDAGGTIGIPIVDHVIIGERSYCSICEWMGTDLDLALDSVA
jgi:DNA repair protein RadC